MKILTRLFTKFPLFWVTFNWQLFKKNGSRGSCVCHVYLCLKNNEHIIKTLNELCDYVRENYDMRSRFEWFKNLSDDGYYIAYDYD